MGDAECEEADQGWQGAESQLRLSVWSRKRRVVVLRRPVAKELAVVDETHSAQIRLSFTEVSDEVKVYEYAVPVTSVDAEIRTIAQHYRDRGDCENNFDELKNHWGWGGFTTQHLKRCRFMAQITALVYNWWSLFVSGHFLRTRRASNTPSPGGHAGAHCLFLDGISGITDEGSVFHPVCAPSAEPLHTLLDQSIERIMK